MINPNYEAEQSVCGCIMMDSSKVMPLVAQIVSEYDFQVSEYRQLYGGSLKLYRENKPVDTVTVLFMLGDEYKTVIMEAAAATPTISHCEEYARQVYDRAQQIRAYEKTAVLLNSLESGENVQTCQKLTGNIMKCFDSHSEANTVSAEGGFLNFCDRLDHPKEYMHTGFSILDKYLFLDKGDFLILGGRPSSGKTAFTLQMMLLWQKITEWLIFHWKRSPKKSLID